MGGRCGWTGDGGSADRAAGRIELRAGRGGWGGTQPPQLMAGGGGEGKREWLLGGPTGWLAEEGGSWKKTA